MSPNTPNPPTISQINEAHLRQAYQDLLSARPTMIQSLTPIVGSPYRSGVLIDAIICGLLAHFHEFARNESAHSVEISNWGGNLGAYFTDFVRNTQNMLLAITPQTPPAPAPPLPKKRAAGRG